MQCGVAALWMVCRHLGLRCSLRELEDRCFPTKEGVSLKGIADAASAVGLEGKGGKATVDMLGRLPLPCILHWNQNHFVVLYRVSRNGRKFRIADPAKGKYTCDRRELEEHWLPKGEGEAKSKRDGDAESGDEKRGIGMWFLPTEGFGELRRRENERSNPLRVLTRYLREYRKFFIQIFLGLLAACLLQLALPFLTQAIVDVGIRREDIGFIWLILLGELMIVVGRTATDFIRRWLLLHISMRVNISLLSDFFIKLLGLPMSFFDTKLTGDLMQRMADHQRVQSFLTRETLGMMFTGLSFVVFGVVLFLYNKPVFGVFLLGSVIYGVWIASFLSRRKVLDYELFEKQAENQNKTFRFITSMQEIKLQGCGRRRRWEWEDVQADLFGVQMKSLRLQQTQEAGSVFINEIKNIVITALAATGVINGSLTLGEMLAIQYIVGQLNSPVEQMMQFLYAFQDVKISLDRINEIHRGRDEEQPGAWRKEFPTGGGISLRGVGFKYDPHSAKEVLSEVDIEIPPGKVTAIVGASGSGKTTLVKLMLGYYPARSGRILIAGRDIKEYDLRWWRGRCGAVMQEGVIFSESIARNIAVDDGEVDPARLREAAKTANIHDFVSSLPLGYDTIVGPDGVGLSQGQKQRLLIARAVYKDPPFIFLDEATNSLDARNEREIVGNLGRFYKGRTVVVVAHRLSTVRDADHIVVLDSGRVAEEGNHDTLISLRGTYFNLIKNQLELGN